MTDPLSEPELTALEQKATKQLRDKCSEPECVPCLEADVLLRLIVAYRGLQAHYDSVVLNWNEVIRERDALQAELDTLNAAPTPPEETR